MILLIQNETCRGAEQPQHPRRQDMNTSYSEFLSTHPPLFSGAKDPLEADDWLHTTKSKIGPLHYTDYQKTLYAAQQGSGGHHTPLRCQQNTMCRGVSSAPLSMATTCQLAQCTSNLQSF
jgi:hypothetical protein